MFKLDLWIFTLCLGFTTWTPVEGQSEVIGSSQPIIASPGDDVILPCHLSPEFDVQELTVEWSRPDLKPDPSDRLSRITYVHVYRHRHEDSNTKNPVYMNRTQLFMDQLEHGNISLKIMNVTLADEGRYRCFVPKLNSRVQSAVVQLVVDSVSSRKHPELQYQKTPPSSAPARTTEKTRPATTLQTRDPEDVTDSGYPSRSTVISGVVVGSILLTFAAVCAYLFKESRQNTNTL